MLKLVASVVVVPLCRIINVSFTTGVFPDALKVAKVVALHKGGPSDNLNNYRPISLLSVFDKIIEKIMHRRLCEILDEHDILFSNQFGFRKGHSTTHALNFSVEHILKGLDTKMHIIGIFI